MDRDSTVGTGFRVDPDELAALANHLHDAAEDAIARARHEYTAAADDPAVIQRRRSGGIGGRARRGATVAASGCPVSTRRGSGTGPTLITATRAAAAAVAGTAAELPRRRRPSRRRPLRPQPSRGRPATLGATALTGPRSTPPRRAGWTDGEWTRRRPEATENSSAG